MIEVEVKQDTAVLHPSHFWDGSLFLWNRRTLYIGTAAQTAWHAKHLVSVIIAVHGTFRLYTRVGWRSFTTAILPPDLPHVFDGSGAQLIVLYFPPELLKSKRLLYPGEVPYTVSHKILSRFLPRLKKYVNNGCGNGEATELADDLISELALDGSPRLVLDPRVINSLECFQAHPTHRFTVAEISAEVALSASRFAHLFREQIGLPMLSYLLELRVLQALVQVSQGNSLTTSAYAAGFADSAHLSRTFRRMTGISPSCLLKATQVFLCEK